jgi:uncharacterized membrane protein (DUF106 family)
MVKHLSTLAVQAIRLHQIMAVPIVRLQHGFIPEQSIRDLKEKLKEFQKVIAEMEHESNRQIKLTND